MYTLVTQRCAVSFGELLQLVVVGQDEERSLDKVHRLHLGHHVLIDAIHDLLEVGRERRWEDEKEENKYRKEENTNEDRKTRRVRKKSRQL